MDSTNAKGMYGLVLTTAECQHNCVVVMGVSSTANVFVQPLVITFENAPTGAWFTGNVLNSLTTISTYTGNTPQTGDAYAVVNSGTFGNAQLVRSTTPANTLTVDSSHRIAEVVLVDTLTTYTGNTPQTGDAYAVVNSGTFGNAQLVRSTTPANTLTVDSSHRVSEVALVDTLTTYTGNTPQTGDAYAVVNSGTFGNAQLVRSTTPANTLTVDSSHRIAEVALVDTLTTYTGNTPQTGDAYGVVNNASFGNAKLVRSTTPGNTLTVDGSGYITFNNTSIATVTSASLAQTQPAQVTFPLLQVNTFDVTTGAVTLAGINVTTFNISNGTQTLYAAFRRSAARHRRGNRNRSLCRHRERQGFKHFRQHQRRFCFNDAGRHPVGRGNNKQQREYHI